ncbi:MAG: OsmC family protein [Ignavibacteriae bacterium]|nr:OsmC family protein [Ignavibacteriota bacterium]
MPTSHIIYKGELRTNATHLKSGQTIITDAPVDNHGKGEAFSPTDLLATALGSCMLTIMGLAAEEHNFSIDGTTVEVTKIMGENPRRVTEVILDFKFQADNYSEKEIIIIEACTKNCPIGKSLHPELKQTINLNL